jgi:ABC-type transport system substrate-binding protein
MSNKSVKRIGLTLLCVLILATLATNTASAPVQRGPKIDKVRWKVTRSPAAQLIEMTLGPPDGSDMWMGMIRPTDVEACDDLGYSLSSRSGMHFCEFGFNMRNPPLDDVNFRHALSHLVPKEKIIGTLFKYINIPISTMVPPAQGLWYNPYVDPQSYSRTEAEEILAAANYTKAGGEWVMPDGGPIPDIRVYIPLEIVAPTSYTIGRMFVEECNAIGLSSIHLEPMDFSTYTDLAFDEWDFDIFWVCWRLGTNPTLLYWFFHSEMLYYGSRNCYGVNWPELDAEIETFYFGLDHPAKITAVKKIQEMLIGGTTTEPLGKPAQAGREQALPLIPVYSRNMYDVMYDDDKGTPDPGDDEGLRGAVNMFGYGVENGWTWMNIEWNTPTGDRPGTTEAIVVPILDEFPETINPASADTVYAADVMEDAFDGLIATNPYTHTDVPWLATSWSYQAWTTPEGHEGMKIEFELRTTDLIGVPVKWQDGDAIHASDVTFAFDFLHDNQIADFWGRYMHYLSSEYTGNTITAYMNTTSQWQMYGLAGDALLFPPQVWGPWDGQPTADIEAWDPSAEAGVGVPTKVYGTGPLIVQHNTRHFADSGYGDYEANRDYWLTTENITRIIEEMFHAAGDVNWDEEVAIEDLQKIAIYYGYTSSDPEWTDPVHNANWCDISGPAGAPDEEVGIDDLAQCGKFYGEPKTVPSD